MNLVHYEQIDLNLLTIFEAVMTELNVSRAAERLNMTQPAVSHALRRLRLITNDELFIKVPSGVSPTPKALELWEPIRDGLLQIRQALSPVVFEPATASQTFTLSMADYTATLLLPKLLPTLEQTAPLINLRIVPNTNINAASLLEQSEVDIALGRFFRPSSRLRVQDLMSDRYVCIMRRGHPLARKKLTLFLFFPFVKNLFSSKYTIESAGKACIYSHLHNDFDYFFTSTTNIKRAMNVYFELRFSITKSG